MPIDPRIPLGVQPLQLPSPLEIYSTVQQIAGQREAVEVRRLAAEEARERRAEKQAERAQQQALGERYAAAVTVGEDGTITLDKVKLFAGAPPALMEKLVEAAEKDETRMTALLKGTLDLDKSRREWLGGEGADIVAAKGHPEAWDTVLRRARDVRAIDAATETRLRAVRDPAEILALAQAWVTRAGGKAGEGFTLSPGQARYGPGGELIAEGPAKPAGGEDPFTLSPGSVRFSPTGEQLASVPATPPAPREDPLVQVMENGVPVWRRRSQAEGQPAAGGAAGAAPTHQQSLAAGFAARLSQAEPIVGGDVGDAISKMSLPSFKVQTESWFAQPSFQSNEVQKYMQASRNFVNAVLRRESGAVISAEEFANAKAQYLPLPGDTADVKAQKKANRDLVFQSMREEAGASYRPPPTGGAYKVGDILTVKGKKVRVTKLLPNGQYEGEAVP